MKCTKTECEYFNRKVFDRLDKVKEMEDKCKLADPASLTNDPGYHEYGPIGVIAWAQNIHSKFVADHKWPGLASKLPHLESAQSNSVQTKGKFTCYHCGKDGHIKPNFPKLQASVPKDDEKQKEWRPLAAWKAVRPDNITKKFVDENKVEWNFCTKCIDFTTRKKGIWSRIHSDAEHKTSSRTTPEDRVGAKDKGKVEANLALIEMDVPIGPPLATTREPSADADPNELVFTPGTWCCSIPSVLTSHIRFTHVPCPIYFQDEDAIEDTDEMPILGLGRDDDSSDDDSNEDDITSNDEGSFELNTFALYYDNETIVNQTKEKNNIRWAKKKRMHTEHGRRRLTSLPLYYLDSYSLRQAPSGDSER
jgi:hypothetical protein